jgi:uncharacterized membrane protein HdeD (DUF308 family)
MMNPSNVITFDARAWVRTHRRLFVVEGVVLMLLGSAAVVVPTAATLALEICIGWILLLSGMIGAVTTVWMRGSAGFAWSLVSAIVGIAAGATLLRWPLSGTVSLTLILILFFVLEGGASIMFAVSHRPERPGRWGWMLWSGVLDLVLALLILVGLPSTSGWAIGLLVGINMIFGGAALIAMAIGDA